MGRIDVFDLHDKQWKCFCGLMHVREGKKQSKKSNNQSKKSQCKKNRLRYRIYLTYNMTGYNRYISDISDGDVQLRLQKIFTTTFTENF